MQPVSLERMPDSSYFHSEPFTSKLVLPRSQISQVTSGECPNMLTRDGVCGRGAALARMGQVWHGIVGWRTEQRRQSCLKDPPKTIAPLHDRYG
jgi:hypothetical protein